MPYAGLGMNVGTNTAKLTAVGFSGEDKIEMAKFYIPLIIGGQAKYRFGNFAPYAAFDIRTVNLYSHGSVNQSGNWNFSYLDVQLEESLQYAKKVSYNLNIGVAYMF